MRRLVLKGARREEVIHAFNEIVDRIPDVGTDRFTDFLKDNQEVISRHTRHRDVIGASAGGPRTIEKIHSAAMDASLRYLSNAWEEATSQPERAVVRVRVRPDRIEILRTAEFDVDALVY